MLRYLLFILIIADLAYSTGCKKVGPESPLEFDSLDQAGSNLGRFTIIGHYLCTVNGILIKVYDIQNPSVPVFLGNTITGATILSLRTYKDSLLMVGSRGSLTMDRFTNTPYVDQVGVLNTSQAFDPFTYSGKYLITSENKGPGSSYYIPYSQLIVYDNKNFNSPDYVFNQDVHTPLDLAADGNNLFVCDSGLKVFDISNIANITFKKQFNIEAQNIQINNGTIAVLGPTGLFQYQYTGDTVKLLSKINIVNAP